MATSVTALFSCHRRIAAIGAFVSAVLLTSFHPMYVAAQPSGRGGGDETNATVVWRCIGCDPETLGEKMSAAEQKTQLNDLWGHKVLREGITPVDTQAAIRAINTAHPGLTQRIYLIAEGGQIPISVAPRSDPRNPRLVITWKKAGVLSVLLSASPGGNSSFLQLIAWDPKKEQFNFYERLQKNPSRWSWAGDSSHASKSRGKGCFDCHHNGAVLMKELKKPWNNWTSQLARIDLGNLPDGVSNDPNVLNVIGAETLEKDIEAGVSQYYNAWLDKHVSADLKTVTRVPELLRHLTLTTSVNLESSIPNLSTLTATATLAVPKNFFLFDDALGDITGDGFGPLYTFPAGLQFETREFKKSLARKQFALRQCNRRENFNLCKDNRWLYEQIGTTFHPFFIPTPSNEDTYVIRNLVSFQVVRSGQRKSIQFISKKFAAAVLMVDFQNPVFSARRSQLQSYAEKLDEADVDARGASNIPALFATEVKAAAADQPVCEPNNLERCTAEQQFLATWNLPDETWNKKVSARIQSYLNKVTQRIGSDQGVDDYVNLAISRRRQFAQIAPINNLFEFSLTLPQDNIPTHAPSLRMQTDGSVAPAKQ